jgi:hypothetical protein
MMSVFQVLQRLAPIGFIVADPGADRTQRLGTEHANSCGAFLCHRNQADRTQQAQMLGNGRPARTELCGDLADAVGAVPQHSENLAPRRIGDRAKYRLLTLAA